MTKKQSKSAVGSALSICFVGGNLLFEKILLGDGFVVVDAADSVGYQVCH